MGQRLADLLAVVVPEAHLLLRRGASVIVIDRLCEPDGTGGVRIHGTFSLDGEVMTQFSVLSYTTNLVKSRITRLVSP